MQLIGISGLSCSGKSTLADLIQEQNKGQIGVIHTDSLLNNLKKILFKGNLTEKQFGENIVFRINNNPLKTSQNKIVIKTYEHCKKLIVSGIVRKRIHDFHKNGYSTVIIEGVSVSFLDLKWTYLVKIAAPFVQRLKRCEQRDDVESPLEELKQRDKDHIRIRLNNPLNYNYTFFNNDRQEKLENFAKQFYDKIICKKEVAQKRETTKTLILKNK